MKKLLFISSLLLLSNASRAADLLTVYQQAVNSDPVLQQAISQRLSDSEAVPINRSALLPNIAFKGAPTYTRSVVQGSSLNQITGTTIDRGYGVTLDATQTIFNFSQFAGLSQAHSIAKQADANLNAAAQDLMIRVSRAYFQVLQDEDTLLYANSAKRAFAKQLDQADQQYKVGIKTITDVYTARASYENSVANTIQTATILDNDRENLRAITNVLYPTLATLRQDFPLVSPEPSNIETWVKTAQNQNWAIQAANFAAQASMKNIQVQEGGHLPTVQLEGLYQNNLANATFPSANPFTGDVNKATNKSRTVNKTLSLNLAMPIFAGGLISAQTNRAEYDYQVATQKLEQQVRAVVNAARQGFLTVNASISQVQADKEAVKSSISSLEGMEAGYKVGTETLVNVLNQQQNVFNAQKQYATDRYTYINNLLLLKQAAGTLSVADLQEINKWLTEDEEAIKDKSMNVDFTDTDEETASKKHSKNKVSHKLVSNIDNASKPAADTVPASTATKPASNVTVAPAPIPAPTLTPTEQKVTQRTAQPTSAPAEQKVTEPAAQSASTEPKVTPPAVQQQISAPAEPKVTQATVQPHTSNKPQQQLS